MASRMGKTEWTGLYIGAALVDVFQWIADLTGVGIVASEAVDPFVAAGIAGYLHVRGVPIISSPSRLGSLFGVTILEEASAGIAPAWVADIWFIHRSVKQADAEEQAAVEQQQFLQSRLRQPLYQDGTRTPASAENGKGPLNRGGYRAAGPTR